MARVPALLPGDRIVKTVLRCVVCGELYTHIEVVPWPDDPYGTPGSFRCECGGGLTVRQNQSHG